MEEKRRGKKDAVISGTCFILYAVVLFLIAFLTLYSFFLSMQSYDDYISSWGNLFDIIFLLMTTTFSMLVLGMLGSAILYLSMGIIILQKQPGLSMAIISFILSSGYLFLWIVFSSSHYDYGMYAINPVIIAGSIFYGILALMLGYPKLSSRKRFVRKYWPLPWILLVASVFVSPLNNTILRLIGDDPYPLSIYHYQISIARLILLFPAYFFGCRWMKKESETDLLNMQNQNQESYS